MGNTRGRVTMKKEEEMEEEKEMEGNGEEKGLQGADDWHHHQQHQRWWREEEEEEEEVRHVSLVELCFHRHNPKVEVQTFLGVFHRMLGEGLIDRYKGLHVL